MKNSINIFALFFLVHFFSGHSMANIYLGKYSDFKKVASPLIKDVLISYGMCRNENDCFNKNLLFYEDGGEYLHVKIYEVKSIEVAKKISDVLIFSYQQEGLSIPFKLYIHKSKHPVNLEYILSFFKEKDILLTMTIEGE